MNSPNGTSCILRYTAAVRRSGVTRNAALYRCGVGPRSIWSLPNSIGTRTSAARSRIACPPTASSSNMNGVDDSGQITYCAPRRTASRVIAM